MKVDRPKINLGIEVWRLVAAYGVIFLHFGPNRGIAVQISAGFWTFVVPFFYVSSLSLLVGKIKGITTSVFFNNLKNRLLTPYFIWSAFYVLLIFGKNSFLRVDKIYNWIDVVFLGQSAVHLYFVPVIVFLHLFVFVVSCSGKKDKSLVLGIFGFALVIAVYGYTRNFVGWKNLFVFPLYVGVSFAFDRYKHLIDSHRVSGAVMSLVVLVSCMYLIIENSEIYIRWNPLIGFFAGVSSFVLSYLMGFYVNGKWIASVSSLTFGIYLIHVVFVEMFEFFGVKLGLSFGSYNIQTKAVMAGMVFALSAFSVFIIKKNGFLNRILMGA